MKTDNKFFRYGLFVFFVWKLFIINPISAQTIEVNKLTGTAQVSIPIYEIKFGDLLMPIQLSYAATGLKVENYDQRFGQGWQLVADASIERSTRGFPDDVQWQGDGAFAQIKGWLKTNDIPLKVENFVIGNDNNSATCSDEVADYSYMFNNFPDNLDTEPDIFNVNAPGLNFQFVFDKDKQIRTIPYQDVQITYTTDVNGQIIAFSVVNDKGIKYTFDQVGWQYRYIEEVLNPLALEAFSRDYVFFREGSAGSLRYNYRWHVSSIEDVKGNKLLFFYDQAEAGPAPRSNEKKELIKYNSATATFDKKYIYTDQQSYFTERIGSIVLQVESDVQIDLVKFVWENEYSEARLIQVKLPREGRYVDLQYTRRFNKSGSSYLWGYYFLKRMAVNTGTCGDVQEYKFAYYNVDDDNNSCYCNLYDSLTNAQDYWGYYNGQVGNTDLTPSVWVYPDNPAVSKFKITQIPGYTGNVVALPGANRMPNANAIAGSLYRITHSEGGVTQLEYENKEYYDKDLNAAVLGGGIRIKKISSNDGLNTNQVTTYEYNDVVTGITSGRAVTVPSFAFAFPNNGSYATVADKVKNSVYRTLYDFSEETKEVIHGTVSEKRQGSGKSVYEFYTLPTWGNPSVGDWIETPVFNTRKLLTLPGSCGQILPDLLTNGKLNYPFPVNPNYEFERGLPKKVAHYDEAGNLVASDEYVFNRSHITPSKIYALKFDNVGFVQSYAKYEILTTVSNLIATKTSKKWSVPYVSTNFISDVESYFYEGDNHRQLTKIDKVNSGGLHSIIKYKYAKDFTTTGTGDIVEQAIHSLKLLNNNALLESAKFINDGNEKVTEASLNIFKSFVHGSMIRYLPAENWKLYSPNGTEGFLQATIGNGAFIKSASYTKSFTVENYNVSGLPALTTDNSKIKKSFLYNGPYQLHIGDFANASVAQIMHATFDYTAEGAGANYGSNQPVTPGHCSYKALDFQPSTSIFRTIDNAGTHRKVIFSCWIKDAASAGTLTVNLQPSAGSMVSYTINYTPGAEWKYYELRMPRPAYPASASYDVSISTSSAIKIDDVLLYPDNANFLLNSYNRQEYTTEPANGQIVLSGQTTQNGILKQYQYDSKGRLIITRDQYDNILETKQYKDVNNWITLLPGSLTFSPSSNISPNTPVQFKASSVPCAVIGTVYKWNFGDNTPEVTTYTDVVSHSYSFGGKYQVVCTISAPGFNAVVSTTPPVSQENALSINWPKPIICAAGIIEKNSAGTCILSNCPPLTALCTETKFQLIGMQDGNLSDVVSVTWQRAPLNSSTWTTVSSTPGNPIVIPFNRLTQSYKVRVRVQMYEDFIFYSDPITVLNNF